MANKHKGTDPKTEALRRRSCLNRAPEAVTDALFDAIDGSDFFDPRDLVQVKYEMLRRARHDGQSVTEAAAAFGLSRPSFYQAQSALEHSGLAGLLPKKPGPRRSHKLSEQVMQFVEQLLADEPSLGPADLAERVQEHFGRKVHPRSVERALARRKKKRD